jgi:hypothetical protein
MGSNPFLLNKILIFSYDNKYFVCITFFLNYKSIYQSLVGSVVIGDEFGREDHGSILATAIGMGLESFDSRTDSRTRLN